MPRWIFFFYWCSGLKGQVPSIRDAERKAGKGLTAIPTTKNI